MQVECPFGYLQSQAGAGRSSCISRAEPSAAERRCNPQVNDDPARSSFRVLTRTRSGYNGATMYDVQLQDASSGALLWAQTFSDARQAKRFEADLDADLDDLADAEFRRKHNVPPAR